MSLFFVQAWLPYLRRMAGSVVNFVSAGGTEGWPGQAAYVAAKEAVLGITVNAAAPMGFSDAFST